MENSNNQNKDLTRILRSSSENATPDSAFISNLQNKIMEDKKQKLNIFFGKYKKTFLSVAFVAILAIVGVSASALLNQNTLTSNTKNANETQIPNSYLSDSNSGVEDELEKDRDSNQDGKFTVEDLPEGGDPDLDFNTVDPKEYYYYKTPSVDVKINGSDGAVLIKEGESFSVNFTTQNVSNCTATYTIIKEDGTTIQEGWGGGISSTYNSSASSKGLYKFSANCVGDNLSEVADVAELHITE